MAVIDTALEASHSLPVKEVMAFVRQICSQFIQTGSQGLVNALEWSDVHLKDLSDGAARMFLVFMSALFREEMCIQDEIENAGKTLRSNRFTNEALLNLAKCAAKRAHCKACDAKRKTEKNYEMCGECVIKTKRGDFRKKRCQICGSFHRAFFWDDTMLGLAGSQAEQAERVYLRALRSYRMKRKATFLETDLLIRGLCEEELPEAKAALTQAKSQRRKTRRMLAKALFPNGKIDFAKGLGWIVATDKKELIEMRDLWQAVRAFVALTSDIPSLTQRNGVSQVEYANPDGLLNKYDIQYDGVFEEYDPRRLSKNEMRLYKLYNSFKGQELDRGPYDGTEEDLTLEYFWGDGYDLKRLTELLGGIVRRSSVVFYEDSGVVIPSRVEQRYPADMGEASMILLQNKMKGVKKPYGYNETYLYNDPRPIGPGNSGLWYPTTWSAWVAKETMRMVTGITYAYLSGESIDLPDARMAVRKPRLVQSQYFCDVMEGFAWNWHNRYWVTPVAQRFYDDVGIWLIVQNLSSEQETVTAIRLTGPDGSEIKIDTLAAQRGHMMSRRLQLAGKWIPRCLFTTLGRKKRKEHETRMLFSATMRYPYSFEV